MRIAALSLLTILCAVTLSAPAFADLYNNGPDIDYTNSYYIDVFAVSDSFVPNASGNMTSFDIALWAPAGATPLTVDWSVGTSSFGSDVGNGGGPWTSLTIVCQGNRFSNDGTRCMSGWDVYDAHMAVGNLPVSAGHTYWLTLTGATDSLNGRDAWDINSGPSMACHNIECTIPSESFTINGSGSTTTTGTTPEPVTILLFGSGVLGLVGVLRRKLL